MNLASGLMSPAPREIVINDLLDRSRRRFDGLDDSSLRALLEDTLYQERLRLHDSKTLDEDEDEYRSLVDRLSRALYKGSRSDWSNAGAQIVRSWANEIHGRFSPRAYRVATRLLPGAAAGLLSAKPRRFRDWNLDLSSRVRVEGDTRLLRALAQEATLILAPTHVSNLDSPMLGFALHQAGLPPFVYGAGLNLFSNPVMGWWMSRLGAYTVDRTKRSSLYKHVLKDYSIRALTNRHHSLFFPGGTRSRSGALETKVKKGLLGTGIVAWQEMLQAQRPDPEVYVVPATLSFQLVLEASTLVNDFLADAGKQRYIISDDEFAQPRRVLAFADRMMELDASVVVRFGQPLDCLGNPVSSDPSIRREQALLRRRYVTNRNGQVEWDVQRDKVYTGRLANALTEAYPKDAYAMVTHVTAWTAWRALEDVLQTTDPFQIIRAPQSMRSIPRPEFLRRLRQVISYIEDGSRTGRWCASLPATAEAVLTDALDRFGRYHKTYALRSIGNLLQVEDPSLLYYYRNRLAFAEAP